LPWSKQKRRNGRLRNVAEKLEKSNARHEIALLPFSPSINPEMLVDKHFHKKGKQREAEHEKRNAEDEKCRFHITLYV
jgi:hypothetical protein